MAKIKKISFRAHFLFKDGSDREVAGTFLINEEIVLSLKIDQLQSTVYNGGVFTWNPPSKPQEARSFFVNQEDVNYCQLSIEQQDVDKDV